MFLMFYVFVQLNLLLYFLIVFLFMLPECGGVFYNDEGTITSPNYPSQYHETNCQWIIRSTPGTKVTVHIEDLDIPDV